MLEDKFRKLIENTGLPLDARGKASLASDLKKLVRRWLAEPEEKRAEYLSHAIAQLGRRYQRHRRYGVSVVGRPSSSEKSEFASDISLYFNRALSRIRREAVRSGYRPALVKPEHEHRFEIDSIGQTGDLHKVVSHFYVSDVPPRIVRRGILMTKRAGSFKISEVRVEDVTP